MSDPSPITFFLFEVQKHYIVDSEFNYKVILIVEHHPRPSLLNRSQKYKTQR